ncbi:hypothetical protein evm_010108 [Chilo suppressalis]|nr:hypothetical protein evm_010108 [Chilo suppressalis]
MSSNDIVFVSIFEDKEIDRDYHSEMDAYNLEKQFSDILAKLDANSVVVMDNAPYHSRTKEKIPTSSNKKYATKVQCDFEFSALKSDFMEDIIMPGNDDIVRDAERVRGRGLMRTRGGRARGTRGGPRGARGGARGGGGATSQLQAIEDLRLGFAEELRTGRPLETPIHAKRRRTLTFNDRSSSSRFGFRIPNPSSSSAAPEPQPSTSSFISPTHSGAGSTCFVPSPSLFVECGNTPRTSRHNVHRTLRDDEIKDFLNYGSEEEEDEDLHADLPVLPIPRTLRMLFEREEDSPVEVVAAGREDAVPEGAVERPNSLFEFVWVPFPHTPIRPVARRDSFVEQCGSTRGPFASAYEAFVSIWDRPIMDHIAQQTNKYAQEYATYLLETGKMGPHSRINVWRDTNVDELYTFFAIMISMGILVKGRIHEYWNRTEDIFQTPGFAVHMSYTRFQLLSRRNGSTKGYHRDMGTSQGICKNNKTFKMTEIKNLLADALQSITAESWKRSIDHVIKEGQKMVKLDGIVDNVVDKFIIELGGSSS